MLEEVGLLDVVECELADIATDGNHGAAHANANKGITRKQALNLYTSHLLSTWNARIYEFAAVSSK